MDVPQDRPARIICEIDIFELDPAVHLRRLECMRRFGQFGTGIEDAEYPRELGSCRLCHARPLAEGLHRTIQHPQIGEKHQDVAH